MELTKRSRAIWILGRDATYHARSNALRSWKPQERERGYIHGHDTIRAQILHWILTDRQNGQPKRKDEIFHHTWL